tara:strand:- start:1933 stop:2130 length:198 start_codon:yes stop_codon:yes gene_type:complete
MEAPQLGIDDDLYIVGMSPTLVRNIGVAAAGITVLGVEPCHLLVCQTIPMSGEEGDSDDGDRKAK